MRNLLRKYKSGVFFTHPLDGNLECVAQICDAVELSKCPKQIKLLLIYITDLPYNMSTKIVYSRHCIVYVSKHRVVIVVIKCLPQINLYFYYRIIIF